MYKKLVCNRTMLLLSLFLISIASVLDGQTLGGPTHGKAVVCYWLSSAYYRPVPEHARFQVGKVDPSLCTHIVYYNAYFDDEKYILRTLDAWLDLQKDGGMGNFKGVVALKDRYPHLKVTIAVGGVSEGSVKFSKMASSPETRKLFIQRVVRFIKHFGFDGLDFYWIYPTAEGGVPSDRDNYTLLIKEISQAFKPRGYILTATIGTSKSILETAYDLPAISQYLDLIHMETWFYHRIENRVIKAVAPLKGRDAEDYISQEYSVNFLISHGVPPHKMVLGLPFNALTFILEDPFIENVIIGKTPIKPIGFKGPLSKSKGYLDYIEVCMELSNTSSSWIYNWDKNSSTPYLRDVGRVICYDNPRSFAVKIKMAVEKDLGGLLAWTLDSDDYLGVCSPESHHDAETYVDFTERLIKINNDSILEETLRTLNIPDETQADDKNGPTYVVSSGKLKLQIPSVKNSFKYKLLHVMNDVTKLAIQEKNITDEMKRIRKEKGIVKIDEFGTTSALDNSTTVKPPKR